MEPLAAFCSVVQVRSKMHPAVLKEIITVIVVDAQQALRI